MADSLDDIDDQLARAIDTEDDERARERLDAAREDLEELRDREDVDEDRAEDLETRIDQHLRAAGERDSYGAERTGAVTDPTDEDAA